MKKLAYLLLSIVLLVSGCVGADGDLSIAVADADGNLMREPSTLGTEWPRPVYLSELYVGGEAVGGSPASPYGLAVKTQDEIVNNSNNLQDDDDLVNIALEADSAYTIDMMLIYASVPTADLKFQLQFLDDEYTGVALSGQVIYLNTGLGLVTTSYIYASTIYFYNPAFAVGGNELSNPQSCQVRLFVVTPSVPITLKLQWAQNTPQVSDTKMMAGSFLEYRKVR